MTLYPPCRGGVNFLNLPYFKKKCLWFHRVALAEAAHFLTDQWPDIHYFSSCTFLCSGFTLSLVVIHFKRGVTDRDGWIER